MKPDPRPPAGRLAWPLLAFAAAASSVPAWTLAPPPVADRLAEAVSERVVEVRREGGDCRDCLVKAVPVAAVAPGSVAADRCIENAVVERFQIGPQRLHALGALFDVPVEDRRHVRILLLAHPPTAGSVPPVAVHAGSLCLPPRLAPGLAFGPVGVERDPALGEKRGLLDWLLGLFGADIERYAHIWVASDPVGAQIQILGASAPRRTNAQLGVTPSQLKSVYLDYRGRRYPIVSCPSQASARPGIARDYHCQLK